MSQNIESLLKSSPQYWRAAYALSTELVKGFVNQHPNKDLTPERLTSFTQEILSQGIEEIYISRDTDISDVLSGETDQNIVEGVFHYAAKNYQVLAGE
jgi:hypothetical protein